MAADPRAELVTGRRGVVLPCLVAVDGLRWVTEQREAGLSLPQQGHHQLCPWSYEILNLVDEDMSDELHLVGRAVPGQLVDCGADAALIIQVSPWTFGFCGGQDASSE